MPEKTKPFTLIDDVAMDASIDPSVPYECSGVTSLSITADWDNVGSPVGTFVLEGSNDGARAEDAKVWHDRTAFVAPALPNASASEKKFAIDLASWNFRWLKVRYVRSSGGAGAKLRVRVFANVVRG